MLILRVKIDKRRTLCRSTTWSGFQSDSSSSSELFQLSELSLLEEVKYKDEQGEPELLGVLGDEEEVERTDERRL